ncbi:hypothetical protein CR513_04017, partial [Mucuna pruriens]
METIARDAHSVEVTNRHLEPIRPTPKAPCIRQHLVERVAGNKDIILCQIFSTSVKGSTLYLYTVDSNDSYYMLKKMFGIQYSTSRPHHLTSMALINLRQGKSEPLRSFVAWFSNIFVKNHNLNLEVTLHSS